LVLRPTNGGTDVLSQVYRMKSAVTSLLANVNKSKKRRNEGKTKGLQGIHLD